MAADLFETYAVTIVATMLLGAIFFADAAQKAAMMMYPLAICGGCIIASVIGTFFAKLGPSGNIMGALYRSLIVSGVISFGIIVAITMWMVGLNAPLTLTTMTITGMSWCGAR